MDSPGPRVTTTLESIFKFGYTVDAAALKDWVSTLPDDAKIKITVWNGNQIEPTETTITATFPIVKRGQP